MLLKKTLSLSSVDLKMEGDTGRFKGYASVFGGVDSYGDTILKGAFESTLRKNGKPKMFYNHQWDMPVGKWLVAKEDDFGLYVEGELTPGLSRSEDVRAAMKHGTLDGLSIGGYIEQDGYDETEKGRVIRKWGNLMEVSPVVFPADGAARADASAMKSGDLLELIEHLDSVRDLESFLRDAGGLSKGAAVALTARARCIFGLGEPGHGDSEAKALEALAARLKRMEQGIRV
jgi:HK97 family phage prohead protease